MTDREILALLEEEPEEGMEQMIARYTGLIWAVAGLRLRETEDIKDCVNETFTEFYFHRERFFTGLVVAALAALLAACAYVVLRWFGVVPGYAVNRDPESPVYVLDKTGVSDGLPAITDGYWNDGRLVVDVRISNNEDPTDRSFPEGEITGFDLIKPVADIFMGTEENCRYVRYIFECSLPENAGDALPLQLKLEDDLLTAVLRVEEGELLLEDAGGYEWIEEKGGLFLLPRLENGELIVSVYTLNEGDYTIASGLTQGVFQGFGCPAAPVTVTAADGTVLTGQPVNYRPYSRDAYLDWNFGPAEPGEYTFQVPYLYQTVQIVTQPEWETDLSAAPYDVDAVLEFTGGEVRLDQLEREKDPEPSNTYNASILIDQLNYENFSWYSLQAEWISHDPERTVVSVALLADHDQKFYLEAAKGSVDGEAVYTRTDTFADAETGGEYYVFRDYLLGSLDPNFTVRGRLGGMACFRWDHPFSIPFTVTE